MTEYWIEQRGGMYFLYQEGSPIFPLWCSDDLDRVRVFRDAHSETGSVLEAKKAVLRGVDK